MYRDHHALTALASVFRGTKSTTDPSPARPVVRDELIAVTGARH